MNHPQTSSNPANAATSKLPGERLSELLALLRQTTSELHSELRRCLSKERNLLISPPPQSHTRLAERLNQAYELFRRGEAKIDLLVVHLGGSL